MGTHNKHFLLGGGLIAVIVAVAVGIFVTTGQAQVVNCNYSFTPSTLSATVTAGSSTTSTFSVSATGADCATDSITVQVWDTPSQIVWPYWISPMTTPLQLNNGSSASISLAIAPPTSGYASYNPLVRILRGSAVLNTMTLSLTINPPPVVACTGMTLNISPTSLTRDSANYTGPVAINYSCATPLATAVVNTMAIHFCKPNTVCVDSDYVTSLTNVSSGTYSIPSNAYTTATNGTYTIRTCSYSAVPGTPSSSACNGGFTNSISIPITASDSSATAAGITLSGTIYRSGTYQDPATGTIRSCVAPSFWMKEGVTSTNARSWHCMPAMPSYTPTTSDTYIPPSCGTVGGTLWAGTTPDSDYCSNTAPTGGGTGTGGTTCASGQVQCPAIGNSPSGCYTTCPTGTGTGTGGGTSASCANGSRCPSGSWCSGGNQFYYPNGDITCVAMPTATGTPTGPVAMPAAPAGTSDCSSTDTTCVSRGQTVPYVSGKSCRYGMSYYSADGTQMTCVNMGESAPAGFVSCQPGQTNCINTGSYGSSSGYCSNGTTGYQKTTDTNPNNDRYCAPMTMGSSDIVWPTGYGPCNPTDANCKQKGDSWTNSNSSYWCTNGTKCSLATGGGSCVGWNEVCPTGTLYCTGTANDNCVEPGMKKTITATPSTSGGSSYWCGGGGMTFYSATQVYCPPKTSSTNMMWTAADVKAQLDTLGAGWHLCAPGNTQCIEPGQTGSSTGWCAWMSPGSGYMPPPSSANTVRTCPSLDGGTITPPPPTTCSAGQVSCQNPLGTGTYCYNGTTCPTQPPIPDEEHRGCDTTMYFKNATGAYVDERGNLAPVAGVAINWKGPLSNNNHYHMCGTRTEPPICIAIAPACRQGETPEMVNGCATGKCLTGKGPIICPLAPDVLYCPPGQVLKTSTSGSGCSFTYCESEGIKPPKPDDRFYLKQLTDQVRGNRFYLKDVEQQLRDADPSNADVAQAIELVSRGKALAVEIDKLIKSGGVKNLDVIGEKMNILQGEIINELQSLSSSFEVYRQCRSLGDDIRRTQEELSSATYGDEKSEAFRDSLASRLEEVEGNRKDACARADEFEVQDLWESVNVIRREFYEFRDSLFRGISTSHIEEMLAGMRNGYNGLLVKIKEKHVDDPALDSLLTKVDAQIARCENLVEEGENEEARPCIDQLTRLFNPVEQLLKKHNISFEVDIRGKDVFEKLVEEKIAKKIESILNEKIANIEVILEERFQRMAVQLTEITEKISGLKAHVDEITQAAANVTNIKEEFKQQISDSRESILAEIQAFELSSVKQTNVRRVLENAFACAARTNWMGTNGNAMREKLATAKGVLETGTLTLEDAEATLAFCEQKYAQNVQESFENGATAFKDVATEQWYHGSAQFAFENKFILGTKDAQGNLTHEFVPQQPTLWGEALAMTMRLCQVPVGAGTAPANVTATPWMYSYVNGAASHGIDLAGENMTSPITRIEAAKLATEVCGVTPSSSSDVAQATYKDFSEFRSDSEGARAVDALTQAGVFQGNTASEFNPGDSLLRTEIAAVLERLTHVLQQANEVSQ